MELREKIAREIWGMDQNSVEMPFERIKSEFVLNDLFDTADAILDIPEIKAALGARIEIERLLRQGQSPNIVQ
jgi:hypothetical protein